MIAETSDSCGRKGDYETLIDSGILDIYKSFLWVKSQKIENFLKPTQTNAKNKKL